MAEVQTPNTSVELPVTEAQETKAEEVPFVAEKEAKREEVPVVVETETKRESIYDLSASKKWTFLGIAALGAVQMPTADTIYLPALTVIGEHFGVSQGIVALSVALFMVCVGLFSLLWGPACDYFGRKKVLVVSSVLYIAVNIVCMLAPSIAVLIVFRAFQGGCGTAYLSAGYGIIADVFPLNVRGMAAGLFAVPIMVGPVVGPIIGGYLAQAEGWRSTFLLLIILGAIILVVIFFFLPETHQYIVLKKLEQENPQQAQNLVEYAEITSQKPKFISPWTNLKLAFIPEFSPYIASGSIAFAALYSTLVLFSPAMAQAPYNYKEGIIGLLYIPGGVGAFVGAVFGGKLADMGGNKWVKVPEARMLYGLIGATFFMILGILIYGWFLERKDSVAGVLVGNFMMTFGNTLYLPGITSYLSGQKQSIAAAASAASFSMNFVSCGVATEVTVYITNAIGFGYLAVMLAACLFVSNIISIGIIYYKMNRTPGEVTSTP